MLKKRNNSSDEKITNCNTAILSAYCDPVKKYPLGMKAYKPLDEFTLEDVPNFKSKLKLALDLIDEAYSNKDLNFSHVLFDSWYFANDVVNEISSKNRLWISDLTNIKPVLLRLFVVIGILLL